VLEPEPPARHAPRAAPRAAPRTAPASCDSHRPLHLARHAQPPQPPRRSRPAHLDPNPAPL